MAAMRDGTPADQTNEAGDVAALADRLRPVMLKLSRRLRREAQKVGISVLDAQILGIIRKCPGMGISELATLEQMSRPTMSAHVKRLEAVGWLTRETDRPDADKRRVQLSLTATGEQTLQSIRRSRNTWLGARLATLTPEECAALDAAIGPLSRLLEIRF